MCFVYKIWFDIRYCMFIVQSFLFIIWKCIYWRNVLLHYFSTGWHPFIELLPFPTLFTELRPFVKIFTSLGCASRKGSVFFARLDLLNNWVHPRFCCCSFFSNSVPSSNYFPFFGWPQCEHGWPPEVVPSELKSARNCFRLAVSISQFSSCIPSSRLQVPWKVKKIVCFVRKVNN